MRVIVLNWENAHLHKDLWISQHRLRHRIFVNRLKWSVQSYNNLEFDQFDTPYAQYVICVKDDNIVCGVTRLLPTTRPYMIQCLWPTWLKEPPPQSKSIWEATRFGCCQSLNGDERSEVILTLIESCISFGLPANLGRSPEALAQFDLQPLLDLGA